MKKGRVLMMAFALMVGVGAWYSCENEGDDEGGPNHNVGNDCLQCHKSGGGGEGVFAAGGSVYKSGTSNGAADVVIKLYNNPDGMGSPVATMTSQVGGNFYTKSAIAFGSGLYVTMTSDSGTSIMSGSVTTGACNSCHGQSTGKLTVQ
jgi:hypothetical protein